MDQKWILTLMILVFYQKMASGAGAKQVNEGDTVEIHCVPSEIFSTVMWFRILDTSDMEFIASFDRHGEVKNKVPLPSIFSNAKMKGNILILTSFKKARDSGIYCCVCIQNNGLKFGQKTQLTGVEVVTKPPQVIVSSPVITTTPCVCKNQGESHSPICHLFILAPLAGGCGLLLLLLIITSLYCNHIRTRRCPHHYKKKPRTVPLGKHMVAN